MCCPDQSSYELAHRASLLDGNRTCEGLCPRIPPKTPQRGLFQDRKSTRLNSQSQSNLVCRLLLEKKITFSDENYGGQHVTNCPCASLQRGVECSLWLLSIPRVAFDPALSACAVMSICVIRLRR